MSIKYDVIDNLLENKYFNELAFLITNKGRNIKLGHSPPEFPWFFQSNIEGLDEPETGDLFYLTHAMYDNNHPNSQYYELVIPLLDTIGTRSLIRVKANLYPRTDVLHEHKMHRDMDYSHSGAILYLNTCDGYTKLNDGTKIESVENRLLKFDPSIEHCSTTTTNDLARFNININYF